MSRVTSCDTTKALSLVEIGSYLPFMFFLAFVYFSFHIVRTMQCASEAYCRAWHIIRYEKYEH